MNWIYVPDYGVFGKIVGFEDGMAKVVLFDSHVAHELYLDFSEYLDAVTMIKTTFDINEEGQEL